MALSMCSSRYCSSFAPLFFLFFLAVVVFLGKFWLFLFIFLIFFLYLGAQKKVTTENELKQVKDVACGIFRRRAQNRQKPSDHEKRILWPLFDQFKIFKPREDRGWTDPKKNFDRFWYMERRNPSSYAKTRPVLRIDSELEDKTGTMRAKLVTTVRIWWKQWRQV